MTTEPARILLVEDSRMDIELTLDAFDTAHLANPIQVVRTGEEALDYLLGEEDFGDREHFPLPHIILLDLKLPGIHGHEVLAEIKRHPQLKRIPVVILTSSKEESDRAASYDNGANSYLVKPITLQGFVAVARQIGDYWLTLNVPPP